MYTADKEGIIKITGINEIMKAMKDNSLLQVGGNNDEQIGEFIFKDKLTGHAVIDKPISTKRKHKND